MNKAILFLCFYIWLGITLAFHHQYRTEHKRVKQLEVMLEKCLVGGTWNLQGYYFQCKATYMGVSDYHIYLGE